MCPADQKVDIRQPSSETMTSWEQLEHVVQDALVHVSSVVVHVSDLEQNGSLRKVTLASPLDTEGSIRPAVTVALWSPRAEALPTDCQGKQCMFSGVKTKEFQGDLRLASTMGTFWKCDAAGERISLDGLVYSNIRASAKFQVSHWDVKPFMFLGRPRRWRGYSVCHKHYCDGV